VEKVAAETFPKGIAFEWTDLTYQEIIAGNSSLVVFPVALLSGISGAGGTIRESDLAVVDHH